MRKNTVPRVEPRTNKELIEAFTFLWFILGESARDAVRTHLLSLSEEEAWAADPKRIETYLRSVGVGELLKRHGACRALGVVADEQNYAPYRGEA